MNIIDHSPWGRPDHVETIAPGLSFVSMPSHGGNFVAEELRVRIPAEVIAATWMGLGLAGWFEEDHDAAYVVVCFPDAFEPGVAACAARDLKAAHKALARDDYATVLRAEALRALGLVVA